MFEFHAAKSLMCSNVVVRAAGYYFLLACHEGALRWLALSDYDRSITHYIQDFVGCYVRP
jgi:hypothetical protein